jgi:SAM-dependent methyltransferase
MRTRVRAALEQVAPPGSWVLDLGCGPGTDDVPLALRGYRITAIDWSPAMVAEARRRVSEFRVDERVRVLHLGIHQLAQLAPAVFDAAYSNFGALNCVEDLPVAAREIALRIRPGGVLVASVIGRICPWEIVLHLIRGRTRRALIRFTRKRVPVNLERGTVWTRYYTPHGFCRSLSDAGFSIVHFRALGLAAPPPYAAAFADRHPILVDRLQRLDDLAGAWPIVRSMGDHFVVVARRV